MNPNYPGSTQGQMPPTGYGAPNMNPGQMRPPGPGHMSNPGGYGAQPKPGPGQYGMPPTANGPQYPNMGQPGSVPGKPPDMNNFQRPPISMQNNMAPGIPPQPRPPTMMSPPSSASQISNGMSAMNISQPRGPAPNQTYGAPPSSSGQPPMFPPGGPNMQGSSGLPPTNQMGGMPRPPTSQMGGSAPGQFGGMTAPPSSQYSGGPPSQYGGAPPTSQFGGAPPTSKFGGAPPTSQFGGAPPTSQFGGAPSTSQFGGAPPTNQFGGAPPVSQMGGIPTSQHGGAAGRPPTMPGMPPPSSSSFGMPPHSMPGPPSGPPTGANQGPPSGMSITDRYGQGPPSGPPSGPNMPPTGSGSFPPAPGPGGFPPSSQYGGSGPGQFPPQPGQGPPGQMPPQPGQQRYPGGTMPGQTFPPNYPGAQPMAGPGGMQQPSGPKKLDPDQMPSPIQVIEDDKANRSGNFQTGKGAVPPLVTTKFVVQDQGNCNPRFMRSTMYNIPCTSDMLKNCHVPFALSISPFAKLPGEEYNPPIVNLGDVGPVRCKRCKAYMNPNMMFIDGGRRFQCVFCGASTDVPAEYFAHLDHTGRRIDSYDRPELCLGSYEFVATKDYCKNGLLPNAPAFIFMIDVSYNSIKSGLVHLICERLKEDVLVNLPKEVGQDESEIRVGFVTYAKEIHFYNVKSNLAQPQMLVVSDLDDVFVPLLDGFLVKLSESEAVIDSLLSQIPQMFAESRETETVLGPVIQAGLDALKSADRSGKLYIFHTSLPIAEAPGKLKNRDDRKLLGTEKEKTILTPQNTFYTKLGQECVTAGCSVDVFLFPNAYIDIATISEVCRLTGGNLYKYSYFQADLDGDRFLEDLKYNVMNQTAFDAILRVRASTGIRAVDFLGNFYMSNTTDVEMAAIDREQAINVEIKHDDKLNEADGAFVQVAVLFTSVGGQRRLRIHNLALNCCTQMADLFRNTELDTLVNYMAKHAVRTGLNSNPKQVREGIMNQVAQILACYRKNCASPSSVGQLILPESMKLLPLYANCIVKSDALQGGSEISTDDRSYLMHKLNAMDVASSQVFFYPSLIPMHDLDSHGDRVPTAVRCSMERLRDNGVYLLENGISMFLWIGHNVEPHWVQQVFSVQSAAQIDIDKCKLLELDNPVSQKLKDMINSIRSERCRYMKLTIVRQRDKLEPWFNHFLVEDKGHSGSASYVDFLCHIHKEIRNLLS
ncbi:protein transport protein Sec24C-like isoform X2 [Ostrea edulis]|uniref:protein transport protein Sec24C-like isoform X2 n=1 Tax=Ostrea edulis TaxID=37623 RepID=UPI0024AEB6D7|nr:protein transport protein Sec24C-like isoform X2 [Ostrea edulis]